jgi:phosphatidylglycerophosphatase A
VVVDEVAGMWTSLLLLPFTPAVVAAAFVAFRVMDVTKPYPARQLEALPGGWGIMSDDMMAGVYANLLVRVALATWGGA